MDQATFLATLRSDRQTWDALVAHFAEQELTMPILAGGRSVKDVIAHIGWYEAEMVTTIANRALRGSPWWELSNPERNEQIDAACRDLPLDTVCNGEAATYAALVAGLEGLDDADLAEASHFEEMPPEWQPWQIIASNCFEHYHQHLPELHAGLMRLRAQQSGYRPGIAARVSTAYAATYADALTLKTGEEVTFGDHDTEWMAFVWCTNREGKSGWAPEAYIEHSPHGAYLRRDYDANELTVHTGEVLTLEDEHGGWYLASTQSGQRGWIPAEYVEITTDSR